MNFKRIVAILLCLIVVLNNVMPSFSLNNVFNEEEFGLEKELELIDEEVEATVDDSESINEEIEDIGGDNESIDEETSYEEITESNCDEEIYEIVDEEKTDVISTKSEIDTFEESDDLSINENEYEEIATVSEISEDYVEVATVSNVEIDLVKVDVKTNDDVYNDNEVIYAMGYDDDGYEAPKVTKKRKLFSNAKKSSIPSFYDARQENNGSVSIIPPVRNQNPYGVCWAVSTIGIIETNLRKKGLLTTDDDESRLSEAALAYFVCNLKDVTRDDSPDIDKPGVEGNDYTEINDLFYTSRGQEPTTFEQIGGNTLTATTLLTLGMGAVKVDENTSYDQIENIKANGLDSKYAFNTNAYEVENAYYINNTDTELIKKAIMEKGSVGFSYNAVTNMNGFFNSYEDSKFDNPQWYYFTPKNITSTNHAIMIVGWDDDVPKERFKNLIDNSTPENNGGWLCRNSWGEDWDTSDNGYFWLSYEETSISKTIYAVDAIEAGKYEYKYHYDTTNSSNFDSVVFEKDDETMFSNIYNVSSDSDQYLEAINLGLNCVNSKFDIHIYTNDNKMENPTDGELKLTQEAQRELAGFYTIELDEKVFLKKGTYYSIVIEPKEGTTYFNGIVWNAFSLFKDFSADPNAVDAKGKKYDFNVVELGQSYKGIKDADSGKLFWFDINVYDAENNKYVYSYNDKLYGSSYRLRGFTNKVTDGETGEVDKYAVRFNVTSGEEHPEEGEIRKVPESKEVEEGGQVEEPENPEAEGYIFKGWYKESSYTNEYNFSEEKIEKDTEIYGKWEEREYIITLNREGGEYEEGYEEPRRRKYRERKALPSSSEIRRAGHRFGGWYENDKYEGEEVKEVKEKTGEDKTYYAKWIMLDKYAVRFNLVSGEEHPEEGEIIGRPENIEIEEGEKIEEVEEPKAEGYRFVGWYREAEFKNEFKFNEEVEGDTDIYGKWEEIEYSITLYLDEGNYVEGYKVKTSRKYTEEVILPKASEVEREGHKYVGWYGSADFSGEKVEKIESKTALDKTYYLKWIEKEKYSISFNLVSGEEHPEEGEIIGRPENIEIEEGEKIEEVEEPKAEGYRFVGWFREAEFKNEFKFNEEVEGDTDIYGKWEEIEYSITLYLNEGQYVEGYKVKTSRKYTEEVILPKASEVVRSGYRFGGWYENDKYEGEEVKEVKEKTGEDKTYYAKWIGIEYILTLYDNGATEKPTELPTKYTSGVGITLPMDLKKNNIPIVGWFENYNEETGEYSGNVYTTIGVDAYGDKILYAKYGRKLTVTFNANGGNGTMAAQIIYEGVPTKLESNSFIKNNFYFKEWQASNGARYSNGQVITITSDITLRAVWEKEISNSSRKSSRSSGGSSGGGLIVKSASGIRELSFDTLVKEISNSAKPKKVQEISQISLNETNMYLDKLLSASGLQNNINIKSSREVLDKTNEVAKGKDYHRQITDIINEASINPEITNMKADVSEVTINHTRVNWSYDDNGDVKLIDKSTNQPVVNKWQAVSDDNGNKTWYKFDESGNMQTGLVVDGGLTFYLRDTYDVNRGKMVVNETITIGGLILTFNKDGALTSMHYDESVALHQLSNAIISVVTANAF